MFSYTKIKSQAKHENFATCGLQSKTTCLEDKMSQNGINILGRDSGHLYRKHPGVE